MASKKWAYVEDLGAGAGKVHNGNPSVDYVEKHVHYRDFNGRNRVLVGNGDPGTQEAPTPLVMPEETFFGRKVGGNMSALSPQEVMEICGVIRSNTQPAISAWTLARLWQHSDDTVDDEELFYYDTTRAKYLSVHELRVTFQDPSLTATGYIDYVGGITSSAGFGAKLLGSWTLVGAELNQSPTSPSVTVEVRMTGTALAGSAKTIVAAAGLVDNTLNVDVTTANPIIATFCTATNGAANHLFNVTWKFRRRPSA